MTYLLILLSIILYFISKNSKSLVATSVRKYRSLIVIVFGLLMLVLFNRTSISMVDFILPAVFMLIGAYYLVQDHLIDHIRTK